jgi:hypothetical protein
VDAPADDRVAELLAREIRRARVGNVVMTSLFLLFMFAYLVALFYFFGLGVVLAACATMASRLPDLLWEIRTGDRVTRQNAPWGGRYIIAEIFLWGALPLLWYKSLSNLYHCRYCFFNGVQRKLRLD